MRLRGHCCAVCMQRKSEATSTEMTGGDGVADYKRKLAEANQTNRIEHYFLT